MAGLSRENLMVLRDVNIIMAGLGQGAVKLLLNHIDALEELLDTADEERGEGVTPKDGKTWRETLEGTL